LVWYKSMTPGVFNLRTGEKHGANAEYARVYH
jgi:hypothetical protein